MKKTKLYIFSILAFFGCLIVTPAITNAQTGANPEACRAESVQFFGFPTWYKYLNPRITEKGCEITFEAERDVPRVLLAIFEIIMRVLGIVAVAMVVWGGFQYITSQGEPEATKNARNTIVNAMIGLGIAVSATAIVNLIGNNLIK